MRHVGSGESTSQIPYLVTQKAVGACIPGLRLQLVRAEGTVTSSAAAVQVGIEDGSESRLEGVEMGGR